MKDFEELDFNYLKAIKELSDFKSLLDSKDELSEKKDILPFFKDSKHLSALIGSYNPYITSYNRIAHEFDIFGDFRTDLAIGDSTTNSYCFVEFEDAGKNSVFKKQINKNTNEWGNRIEKGFGQIIDWFYKLDDQKNTKAFRNKFLSEDINSIGLLIVGRSKFLSKEDKQRLYWRSDKLIVNSCKVLCFTFDDLHKQLEDRLKLIKAAIKVTN